MYVGRRFGAPALGSLRDEISVQTRSPRGRAGTCRAMTAALAVE